jgi:predicted SnoaL-like aldol condensation-catalyzing enzyme
VKIIPAILLGELFVLFLFFLQNSKKLSYLDRDSICVIPCGLSFSRSLSVPGIFLIKPNKMYMKKYLPVLIVALCCLSCNSKKEWGLSPTAQKNLEVNHLINRCFETKDFSKIGDYIAQDAVDHGGESGDIRGLDNLKKEFEKYAAGMDDQKMDIIKELADSNYVMSWARYTGKYTTDGRGHKAGDRYDMKMLDISRFENGKATEHWTLMEPGDVMKMMNGQQSSMPMQADSSKKKI